ncbi:protein hedgehog [Sitodiplosis mosellana]|uniref:protein hedgehog n=1 Tax=Sitodiplosis mosellana TaxID=263140 RepID=UPI0024447232|nr:protein hedgehog [Sitodiplosis mosellana]
MSMLVILVLFAIFTSVMPCGPGRGIGGPRRLRKLTPLVFKQHVPNVSENTINASGLQEGKITRNHEKFKDFSPNYNEDIIFKDDEGTGADRVMTQRCKEKLDTLAISVMNQWPGVRLRVIEGWDEDDAHGFESLHYEGRAVDVTTSDRDRSKNGMLARLAVEAGFDWVYYESRAHVHCSVKSDSSQAAHQTGCFTGDSTAKLVTGETRLLSELRIGDQVLSMDADGQLKYSEVYMFLDRDAKQKREFIRIETEDGSAITATPSHLIYTWQSSDNSVTTVSSVADFQFAERIQIDDFVLTNVNGTLEPRRVKKITVELHRGVYAPLTYDGTIVVNSIAASCYALVEKHSIAHISFVPMRTLHRIEELLGVANGINANLPRGIHWYARALTTLKDTVLPSKWFYHS